MPWDEVLHKFKTGALKSSSGAKVKSRDQAIAIMLSEKRAAQGGKKEYQSSGIRHPGALSRAKKRVK